MSNYGRRVAKLLIVASGLCVGCSDDGDRLETFPVHGQVTVNGQPASGCVVTFVAQDQNLRGKIMPAATADETGAFSLTTFETGDGAPAGKYGVGIRWPAQKTWPSKAREQTIDPVGLTGPDKLLGRLSSPEKSELIVTVEEDENILEPFEFSDVPLMKGAK